MKRKENMRHLSATWKHIRRSPYQAFAAILITTLTFSVISVFTLVILGSSQIISYFESKPQVTAFFKDEAKPEEIDALKNQIEASDKVSTFNFVSKKQALEIYKEQNKDDPLLLELVTAEILPASLEISTKRIEYLEEVADFLKQSPLVSEVIYQKDIVSALTSWTNAIRQVGLGLTVVLAAVSILIMTTIISIKISQKKEEIEILRLIGATYWYIRWPFILEGIFYGVVGAILGWAITTGTLWYATPFLMSFLKGIPILPVSPVFLLELLGANIAFAIFLGMFSSFWAVFRYLK